MKYLSVTESTTLSNLANRIGNRNVETVLAANDLKRTPNIGKQFINKCNSIISPITDSGKRDNAYVSLVPDYTKKSSILNTMVENADVFEEASLLDDNGWKVLSTLNTFPNRIKIPDTITIPDSDDILGNGIHIADAIYKQAMWYLSNNQNIDPAIFNQYSNSGNIRTLEYTRPSLLDTSWFKLPWGQVSLYSSLANSSIDFPVYPEELSDSRKANYNTMPNMLYQYEPWYTYESSGPRTNVYKFHMHRHLWTGDHTDGKANELIRFCEANCFPNYAGSAVTSPTVTLYIAGRPLINGNLDEVHVDWSGPIADDGWYLEFTLELTITEVSQQPLNYTTVRNLPLIG